MIKIQNSILSVLLAALSLILMGGCSSDAPNQAGEDFPHTGSEVPAVPVITTLSLSKGQKESLKLANDFSFDLYAGMAEKYEECFSNKDGNFAVSPLSTNIALGMAANYLDGPLKAAIISTLGYSGAEDLNETSRQVLAYLNNRENTGMEMYLANSLWWSGNSKNELNKMVVDLVAEYYFAPNFGVDLESPATYGLINAWVAENTGHMIPQIFDEEHIVDNNNQFSINALYANAEWLTPFDSMRTRPGTFTFEEGDSCEVEMMHNRYEGEYTLCEDFEAFTIPFRGSAVMTIVLPAEGKSATELSKSFSKDMWTVIYDNMATANIGLGLPKFSIETGAGMTEVLKSIGIDLEEDVRNMLYNDGRMISLAMFQKTALSVNEEGAKIAAAAIAAGFDSGLNEDLPSVSVTVNRPFLYFITEQATGSVLLAGRVCTPVKK